MQAGIPRGTTPPTVKGPRSGDDEQRVQRRNTRKNVAPPPTSPKGKNVNTGDKKVALETAKRLEQPPKELTPDEAKELRIAKAADGSPQDALDQELSSLVNGEPWVYPDGEFNTFLMISVPLERNYSPHQTEGLRTMAVFKQAVAQAKSDLVAAQNDLQLARAELTDLENAASQFPSDALPPELALSKESAKKRVETCRQNELQLEQDVTAEQAKARNARQPLIDLLKCGPTATDQQSALLRQVVGAPGNADRRDRILRLAETLMKGAVMSFSGMIVADSLGATEIGHALCFVTAIVIIASLLTFARLL